MKNKLLVSLFVVVAASLAFTSCKPKSDAKDVCDDLVKASIHKSPRSLLILNGDVLTIKEYEFASASVGDNRVIYRELSFGNGAAQTKKVENLTYQYGAWDEHYTAYSMSFSPATRTLLYGIAVIRSLLRTDSSSAAKVMRILLVSRNGRKRWGLC